MARPPVGVVAVPVCTVRAVQREPVILAILQRAQMAHNMMLRMDLEVVEVLGVMAAVGVLVPRVVMVVVGPPADFMALVEVVEVVEA